MNCLKCKHWGTEKEFWVTDEWTVGVCKRYPPVALTTGKMNSAWPTTCGGDHCGEFSARED